MTDNVIDFTQEFVKRKVKNDNIPTPVADLDKEEFERLSLSLAFAVTSDVIGVLERLNVGVERNVETVYDLIMLLEALRAVFYRAAERPYPLHDLTSTVFDVEDPREALQQILDEIYEEDEQE